MSTRVHSNIGHNVSRQLPLQFNNGASAVGIAVPAKLSDAMGISGGTGIMSFSHDSGAQRTLTFWIWSELRKKWQHLGPVAAVYTMTCDPDSIGSVSIAEGVPFFIQADANITNFWMGGTRKHEANPLPNIQGY